MIKIFVSHGFSDAEDLADQTINRVITRLPDIKDDYVGEPARYFHGVARNIIREARRRKEILTDAPPEHFNSISHGTSEEYECLLKCLQLLTPDKRELILDYHLYEKQSKIEHHKRMARELNITEGALRTRAHHIRATLEKCVSKCMTGTPDEMNSSTIRIIKRGVSKAP